VASPVTAKPRLEKPSRHHLYSRPDLWAQRASGLAQESGRNAAGNHGMMDAIATSSGSREHQRSEAIRITSPSLANAGAIIVGALVGSPLAKGLFNRAIGQSGGWMGLTMGRMAPAQNALANGVKTMEALGVKTIAELRAKPLNELTGLSGGLSSRLRDPEDVSLTFMSGRQNAVDVPTGPKGTK
jgi:para-nitrobenzyl esterase